MSDHGHVHNHRPVMGKSGLKTAWQWIDKAILASILVLAAVALLVPADLAGVIETALEAFFGTLPFILFAVFAVAYLKATGAEGLLAKAFEGNQVQMIVLAAVLGGLSPFCSCEIIPFIAALLAVGAPLSAVMALWLASPLMDPAMFAITASGLGVEFAVVKAISAIMIGVAGGMAVMAFAKTPVFSDPLREVPAKSGCCGSASPFGSKPEWQFWKSADRRQVFGKTALENLFFLGKWLMLAYVLEAVMIAYVPASWIANALGGTGVGPIIMGALVGAPAYLNGYAAVPLLSGLLEQGMAPGAAMSFIIAGGVSCIPAAVAVWALVKPKIFAAYLGLGFSGAIAAGLVWSVLA